MATYTFKGNKSLLQQIRKSIAVIVVSAFVLTSVQWPVYAQVSLMPFMPKPGVMVHLSPEFTPAYLKGIVIHPENALKFDFIVYKGDQALTDAQKRQEYTKLAKYFLASLAIPDDDQWVNLSPYEKDRIIKDDFGKTEMGRDLLAQDYMLKQITASLIYPEDNLGKKFWERIYEQAQRQYGTTQVPVNTFNKVWIIPDNAEIYEKGNTAYILKNHLKVMMEEDYLSLQNHSGIQSAPGDNKTHSIASKIVKEIVLPELEREVNEGKNFAALRQVYSGMLLAAWYKRALKESLLSKIYANQSKLKGIDQDPKTNEEIYQHYLRAYKMGVFNYIKEDVDKYTNETIPRKYFSGGVDGYARVFDHAVHRNSNPAQAAEVEEELSGDDAMTVLAQETGLQPQRNIPEDVPPIDLEKGYSRVIRIKDSEGMIRNIRFFREEDGKLTFGVDGQKYKKYVTEGGKVGGIKLNSDDVLNVSLVQGKIILQKNSPAIDIIDKGREERIPILLGLNEGKEFTLENGSTKILKMKVEGYAEIKEVEFRRNGNGLTFEFLNSPGKSKTIKLGETNGMVEYKNKIEREKNNPFFKLEVKFEGNGFSVRNLVATPVSIVEGDRKEIEPSSVGTLKLPIVAPKVVAKGQGVLRQAAQAARMRVSPLKRAKLWGAAIGADIKSRLKKTPQVVKSVKAVLPKKLEVTTVANPSDKEGSKVLVAGQGTRTPPIPRPKARSDVSTTTVVPSEAKTPITTAEDFGSKILIEFKKDDREKLQNWLDQYLSKLFKMDFSSRPDKPVINKKGMITFLTEWHIIISADGSKFQLSDINFFLKDVATYVRENNKSIESQKSPDANLKTRVIPSPVAANPLVGAGQDAAMKIKPGYHIVGGRLIRDHVNPKHAPPSLIKDGVQRIKNIAIISATFSGLFLAAGGAPVVENFINKLKSNTRLVIPHVISNTTSIKKNGGIDFNASHLNLEIKRDGNGVPLPISQQDLENIHIDGLTPVILDIRPAMQASLLSQLQGSPNPQLASAS